MASVEDTNIERLQRRERELLAEVARLKAQIGQGDKARLSEGSSTPAGRDELFSAVEKTRMPMILTDPNQPDDPVIFVNRAFQILSGYPAEALLGRNCRFLQGKGTDPAHVQQIRDALTTNSDIAIEILNYRRDGTPFVNELYISPVFDHDGRLLYRFGSQLDITGYRRAREALDTSERRQRAILDSSVDFAIVVTDRNGRVTDWNTGAERTMGWSADEMLGHTVERIFTPEDRAADRAGLEMRQAIEDGRASDERWHLKADGCRFFASGEMMPLREADGTHAGFVKILRDRTAEHEAGKALRRTEESLRRAEEAGGVGLFTLALPDGDLQPSPEFCRLYGLPVKASYPPEAIEGLVHPDDRALVSNQESRRLGAVTRDVEYRIRRADTGEVRWIARTAEIVRHRDARPTAFSGVVRDITEQRTAQLALKTSEAYWRGLFERLEEGFLLGEVVRDDDGRVVDWRYLAVNPAWGRMVEIEASAVVGKTVRALIPGVEDVWVDEVSTVVETGIPSTFLRQVGALDRWYEGHVYRTEGDRFAVIFMDVTERRQEERRRGALLDLGDRLREATDTGHLALIGAEIIGRALDADRVGYGTVAVDGETFTVESDWTAPGFPTLAGRYRMDDYGLYAEDLRRGRIVTIPDVRQDARTAGSAANLEAVRARSLINLPVTEGGRTVAILYINSGMPRSWSDGNIAFARDVAERLRQAIERRRAEEALRASESDLRLVADALPVLVGFIDSALIYRFANEAYREWFGRAPEEVVGQSVRQIAGEAGFAMRRTAIEQALGGEPVRMDFDWPRPDGSRRIADIRYTPRRDAAGAVDGFYVFVQDITVQREVAAFLQERAETLAREVAERTADRNALWQLSRDLMLRCTFQGLITAVNPAWQEILGWRESELLGANLFDLIHPDDLGHTVEAAAALARGTSHTRLDNRYRTTSGEYRWISWSSRDAEGLVNAVGRDITAEKDQALALEAAAEALRQSQKMEAVAQLTGGVAHDFNNLLTIIRSSVDFLRRPNLSEDRRKRYMDAVSETVDRAAKLTSQLLAFARRQALKPEVFEVGARLKGIAEMLDTVTGARVRVVTQLPEGLSHVHADLSQFETALVNMAVNARDAMDGEGILTLRLHSTASMPPIRGHAGGAGTFAVIEVIDTGSGIAADQIGRIFEPFFTTKEVGKGTGLGLSQVFGFAKQSGGDVDVQSELGRGTTFRLYLPQVAAELEHDLAGEEDGPGPDGGGQRVLVVEDNVEVGRFATQILEDLGYQTTWAANAEEALEKLGPEGDGYDIVFSDVVMPGMGGIALGQELRRRLPTMPVVLASGYSHVLAEDTDHGFELLQKPYSADQLSRVLRRSIGAQRPR